MIRRGAWTACARATCGRMMSRNGKPSATPAAPRRSVRLSRCFIGASSWIYGGSVQESVGLGQPHHQLPNVVAAAFEALAQRLLRALVGRRFATTIRVAEELGGEAVPDFTAVGQLVG